MSTGFSSLLNFSAPTKNKKNTAPGKVGQDPDRTRWYHFNDATVSAVSESEVVSREAYLLFYERVV